MREEGNDFEVRGRETEDEDLFGMSAAEDPVLAELWNNEKDAEYDRL